MEDGMDDYDVIATPKTGRTTAIVAIVCLALGGAGGFFAAGAFGGGGESTSTTAEGEEESVIVDLGEFSTNLRDTAGGRMVKLRVAVETTPSGAAILEAKELEIRDAIVMLLSDYTIPQLNGADARMVLREDVEIRLDTILGPDQVTRIYLPDFIVQ